MIEEIDYTKEYDNSSRVENSDKILDQLLIDAADFRETPNLIVDMDVEYGPEPRNKMDIYWPDNQAGNKRRAPLVMFIHGGYWQMMDRSAFSHMAKGLNANGFAVAIPSYTLCPDITIDGIITEMRRACLVLFQRYKKTFTVIGHSAGGHLAACMMATDWEGMHSGLPHDLVRSAMGISGIYDLIPLINTPTNEAVGMDKKQAKAASPLHWMPDAIQRFEAWVGADESNEFHRQSRELAARWNLLGTPTTYISDEGSNHFTIINALTRAESDMTKAVVELVKKPRIKVKLPQLEESAVLNQMQDFSNQEKTKETPAAPETKSLPVQKTKATPKAAVKNKPKKRGISKTILAKHATKSRAKSNPAEKTKKQGTERAAPAQTKPHKKPRQEQPKASIGGKPSAKVLAASAKKITSKKKPNKSTKSNQAKAGTKK